MPSSYLRSQLKEPYRRGFTDFLSKWNWDLHLVFYFHSGLNFKSVSFDFAIKKVKSYLWSIKRRSLRRRKFAGIIIAVQTVSTHCHVVLISDHSFPRRLTDLSEERLRYLEGRWSYGALLIKKVYYNQGICSYLASRRNIDIKDMDNWDIQFFRPQLLSKLAERN
ncbi:MAG: hypothetical protein ACYTFE_07170 [Planctomycetota bacterium]|jgi:hypothetical protein